MNQQDQHTIVLHEGEVTVSPELSVQKILRAIRANRKIARFVIAIPERDPKGGAVTSRGMYAGDEEDI